MCPVLCWHRKGSYGAALLSFDWQQDHTARPECYLQENPDIRYSSSSHQNRNVGPQSSDIGFSERQALLNSDRNRVKRFDWKNDNVAKAHESSGVTSILYSPCGRFIVSSGNDRKVRLWSSNNGYLHAINYDISSSSNLPFSMAMISDFECGGDDVLAYPDGEKGDIALVALHSSTGKPFNRLRGHFGAVTSLAYRKGYSQLISAARDGMIHVWDSSLAQLEKESSRRDDTNSEKERWSGGSAVTRNDDDWSDSGGSEGDTGDTDGHLRPSAPRRSFVPPIVQRYLDDAAEAARLLILDRERERERARAAVHRREIGSGSAGSRSSGTAVGPRILLQPNSLGRDTGIRTGTGTGVGAGMGTWAGTGSTQVRKLVVSKPKRKDKEKEKEKSYRERAEIVFALQTAAALRGGVYDPSTSSSSSSSFTSRAVEVPPRSTGSVPALGAIGTSSSGTVAAAVAVAAAAVAIAASGPPRAHIAGDSGVILSLRQREKEKEAEHLKVKKTKSTLSNLRDKYGVGTANKKSRR
jgi:WD domain, G-beta repeat